MTITEASREWKLSPYRIRELIKSGKIPATLNDKVPVPYYEIPNDFKFERGRPGYPAGRPRTTKATTAKTAAKPTKAPAQKPKSRSAGSARKKVASAKR